MSVRERAQEYQDAMVAEKHAVDESTRLVRQATEAIERVKRLNRETNAARDALLAECEIEA